MAFQGDADSILLPLRKQLQDPGRGGIKVGWGKIPFTSFSVQTLRNPRTRSAFIFLIKSCITLAAEASSVPEVWGGGEVCGML